MKPRTVEDRLREEYFVLLPEVRRVLAEVETEVRYCLLPLSTTLDRYERLVVTSRIKECESAVGSLRRRQEAATFDSERADSYTLTALNDLAGIRILTFPRSRWMEADKNLRSREPFSSWRSDPIPADDPSHEPLAFKYYGYCSQNKAVRAEVQLVPMLIGFFLDVEHSAIYKPSPELKSAIELSGIRQRKSDVLRALKAFEDEFDRLVRRDPLRIH